jgi:hypothetical protein
VNGVLDNALTLALGFLVPVVETCGAMVIVLEVIRTVVRYVFTFLKHLKPDRVDYSALRIRLGEHGDGNGILLPLSDYTPRIKAHSREKM